MDFLADSDYNENENQSQKITDFSENIWSKLEDSLKYDFFIHFCEEKNQKYTSFENFELNKNNFFTLKQDLLQKFHRNRNKILNNSL